MLKNVCLKGLFLSLIFSSGVCSAKDIQYVSDQLTIPMRTGTTTSHKILKFLKSGMAVEVLETSADQNHARVVLMEDDTKTGWVETRLLMPQASAREQLVNIRKQNQALKDKHSELKKELKEQNRQNADLLNVQTQLESNIQGLENKLSRLKVSAANPIRIAEENEQLKQQLNMAQAKTQQLQSDNAVLSDQSIKQWFMIGAAVSMGSLILGLLITRISWRKKSSWAGSSF